MTTQPATARHKLGAIIRWWAMRVHKTESRRSFILAEACIIGAVSAVAVIFFSDGVAALTTLRKALCHVLPAPIILPLVGLIGGTICGAFVKFIAPEISGSGIPQVKAFLKGFPIQLNFRVAISKLVGGIVALGVGFPLGREGPTVQLGAATAAVVGRVGYQSPRLRRQLIAAGAGAGLAAAFNAPLAGVMFVVEELSKQVSSLSTGTALLACFFAGIVSRYLGNHSLDVSPASLFPKAAFYPANVPFCIVLGIASGLLGALFNEAIIRSIKLHDKLFKDRFVLRIALAGLICGGVIGLLPPDFRDFAGIKELIFEHRSWRFATVALLANFVLTVIAYGSGAPGGLFAPSLNIGAALGALIGIVEVSLLGSPGSQTTLALAGMGALFAAVARVPLTATVVVFEITADFNLLLPLMICSITSFFVAEKFSPGSLYDRLLELQGIHIEESDRADVMSNLRVRKVMRKKVETVEGDISLNDLMQKFNKSQRKAFPVTEAGKLIGIVTQTDVLNRRQFLDQNAVVRDVMTPDVVTATTEESVKDVIMVLDQHGLGKLPVIDDQGAVIGIISHSDIIKALASITSSRSV
jgi:CIC family chloride channel protein